MIPVVILWAIAMYFALKIEKIKKDYNIQTYKEIIAFTEGKRLDEIQQIEEKAKRPYQNIMKPIIGALFALLILGVMSLLF